MIIGHFSKFVFFLNRFFNPKWGLVGGWGLRIWSHRFAITRAPSSLSTHQPSPHTPIEGGKTYQIYIWSSHNDHQNVIKRKQCISQRVAASWYATMRHSLCHYPTTAEGVQRRMSQYTEKQSQTNQNQNLPQYRIHYVQYILIGAQ